MNLAAYDKIDYVKSDSKIYIYNKHPYIVTRNVVYRKYYCFVTRYEPDVKDTSIYLVLLDDKPPDRPVAKTRRDEYGRLKFNMSIINNKLKLPQCNHFSIKITTDTHSDDGDIYKLEIESD